jgi:hypothetical protein
MCSTSDARKLVYLLLPMPNLLMQAATSMRALAVEGTLQQACKQLLSDEKDVICSCEQEKQDMYLSGAAQAARRPK